MLLVATQSSSFLFFLIFLYLFMFLQRSFTTNIRILAKLTFAAKIRFPEDRMGTAEPRDENSANTPLPHPFQNTPWLLRTNQFIPVRCLMAFTFKIQSVRNEIEGAVCSYLARCPSKGFVVYKSNMVSTYTYKCSSFTPTRKGWASLCRFS